MPVINRTLERTFPGGKMETRGSGSSDPACLSRMMSFHSALPDRTEETGHHLSWDCAEDADNGKQLPRSAPEQSGVSCWGPSQKGGS